MACQTAAMKELVGALTENHLPATPDPASALPSGPTVDAMPRAAAASRHEILRLLATGQSELDENGELCVLQGRLYLASLAGIPVPTAKKYFVTLSKKMRYIPFCADFGPFNLGRVMKRGRGRGSTCALPSTCIVTSCPQHCAFLRLPPRARQVDAP